MRSGCFGLALTVGAASLAAVLVAISTILVLSFVFSALGQPAGATRVLTALVAAVAGLAFFLIGRGIWRDLKRRG